MLTFAKICQHGNVESRAHLHRAIVTVVPPPVPAQLPSPAYRVDNRAYAGCV